MLMVNECAHVENGHRRAKQGATKSIHIYTFTFPAVLGRG